MTANNPLKNRLIEKVQTLSIEQIKQVEQFIDYLNQEDTDKELTLISTKISESVFNKIWDNSEDADYDNI